MKNYVPTVEEFMIREGLKPNEITNLVGVYEYDGENLYVILNNGTEARDKCKMYDFYNKVFEIVKKYYPDIDGIFFSGEKTEEKSHAYTRPGLRGNWENAYTTHTVYTGNIMSVTKFK